MLKVMKVVRRRSEGDKERTGMRFKLDQDWRSILKLINEYEPGVIESLEGVITVLENAMFLVRYLQGSSKWSKRLNKIVLRISKIWMVLTVKTSVVRYWKLLKLKYALTSSEHEKLITKLQNYTLINFGLCLIEAIEILDLQQFAWLISIYSVYRMVGNGTILLEEDEEKRIQHLFELYRV